MARRQAMLTAEELNRPFQGEWANRFPPIVTVKQLAALLEISPKTVYEWIAKGRLAGAHRRRGKHQLIWRGKALDLLFNGPDWSNSDE